MPEKLENLVSSAVQGDKKALEHIVETLQGPVYKIAIRMLFLPSDAEDATQEILIKVVTHLSSFRGESSLLTWVYRIAINHLLTIKRGKAERLEFSFESLERDGGVHGGGPQYPGGLNKPERDLLTKEVRIGCLLAMMLCLDRKHRIAFILGSVFEMSSADAAYVLEISPEAYRKRLSRARNRVVNHLKRNCSLYDETNLCRCDNHVSSSIQSGWLRPQNLLFARKSTIDEEELLSMLGELSEMKRLALLFQKNPDNVAPLRVCENIKKMVSSGEFRFSTETQ